MSVWSALWRDLNTPDRFAAQPYLGLINQVGHLSVGRYAAETVGSIWHQTAESVPNLWAVAVALTGLYVVLIELVKQKWSGVDTVNDSGFFALGAFYLPLAMSLTPSGRWFRVGDWSFGNLVWLACVVLALALYVYPRARRAYGGTNDPAE